MNLNDFVVIPNKPKSVKLNARNLRELRMETVTLAQQSKEMEERLLRLKESMSREKEERVRSGRSRWRSGQALSDPSTKNKEKKFQKLSAGRVKITVLKDEPHAEEVRGGVERALPPASNSQLSSRRSRLTGKACGQCEARMAGLMCAECGEDYCVGCFARFHQKGALKLHRMIPFQSEIHTSVSMLDVVNRFQRQVHPDPDPSLNPKPYKIPGPGAQTTVCGGERSQHDKTQAPPITTRSQHAKVLFLNVGREEGEEDDDDEEEEEEEEEGSKSFLLVGEYDEKESSRSFQEALREWRGRRREGGERRKGGEAVWRPVTAQPGTAVRGTQAGLGGPDEGCPTGGPPIRVEFQQYSLSYLDRLLLKKHRRTPIEAYQPLYPLSLPLTPTHSEGETTPSLTVEELELRRYCASLFSVASGSPPPERAPSGAWLSIQELDETIGGGVGKEVFAEEEEDKSTLFTLPPLEGTTLNATQSPQPIHSTPRSPQPIHSTPRSPQPIHSTPRSPQPVHSTPRSPQPIHSTPRSPQPIHSTPRSPQPIHSTPRSPQPMYSTSRSPQAPSQLTAWSKPKARPSAEVQLSPLLGCSPRKPKTSACLPASPGVWSSVSARHSDAPFVSPSSPHHILPSSPPSDVSSSAPLSPAPASFLRSAVTLAPPRPPAPNCSPPPLKASRSSRNRQPPPSEFHSLRGRPAPPFTPSELAGSNANPRLSPPPSPSEGLPLSRAVSAQFRHRPLSPSISLSSCSLPDCAPSPQDTWCIDSPPPSPSVNLSSPNQMSFRLQSPSPSLSGSEVKQEKDPEPPTGIESPLMLMSDSETDHVAPMPDPGPGLVSEPSAALRVLAQREGTGSDRFCGLEGFLTLGLDLGSAPPGPSLTPAHTDQDTHHTAQSQLGPLTGSASWRPIPSSRGNTEDPLVATAMTSANQSPSQPIQNCDATPTRRRAVSASGYHGGLGGATPMLNRPASSFSRPGSASLLRPLSRAAREIQEICGVDQEDWGDPEQLDKDADSLALTRLEEEFRLMAPEPIEPTRVQEIKDTSLPGGGATVEGQHQRGGPDRVVGEYQSDEEEEMRDQLRDRQTVLSLP